MQRCRNGQECPPAATLLGSVGVAEWHRDLADLFAGRVGVRQGGRAGPDPVSAGVDLQRPEPVLGVAGAFGGDPVVAERSAYRVVAKKLFEGIDGGAGVGVALGEGMPKSVGEHPFSVERRELAVGVAVGSVKIWQCVGPDPHGPLQVRGGKGFGAVGLVSGRGNSTRRSVGVPGNAALVRACWARMITTSRSWIGNRHAVLADLGHVLDEDRGRPALPSSPMCTSKSRQSKASEHSSAVRRPTPASSCTAAVMVGPASSSRR